MSFFFVTNISIAKIPNPKFQILVGSKKKDGLYPPIFNKNMFNNKLTNEIINTKKIRLLIFLKNLTATKKNIGNKI